MPELEDNFWGSFPIEDLGVEIDDADVWFIGSQRAVVGDHGTDV